METLSERKKRILHAVVASHIKTADPVGSRTVARTYRMGLSSATIRRWPIQEMGYLEQPHTPRIPSQKGYRYWWIIHDRALSVRKS